MLAADVTDDAQVLDRPFNDLLERVGDIDTETPAPPAGTRIGPFTLLDQLGEGGSSVVYRAEREQSGVYQQVALKLLRRGLYAEHERRHFRVERRALAQLRHPGIAHLIEGGVTETGVPCIALELIDGTPITEHVRDRSLDLRRRLAPACQRDTAGDARQSIERDAYRWNPLLLSAHVALARIELADGRADLAAARLHSAIDHASTAVDPSQPCLLNARLWQSVAETRLHRCDDARAGASAASALASKSGVDRNPLVADADAAVRASTECGRLVD